MNEGIKIWKSYFGLDREEGDENDKSGKGYFGFTGECDIMLPVSSIRTSVAAMGDGEV